MRARISRLAAFASLLTAVLAPAFATAAPPPDARGWMGEELPLPLAVRTAQDLAVKAAAERQYLIFNLLAGGKLAWDQGEFATAAGERGGVPGGSGPGPGIGQGHPTPREGRRGAGGGGGGAAGR